MPLIRIRANDYLKEECQLLHESVDSLYSYYGELKKELQALEQNLVAGNDVESSRLMTGLKAKIERISLDAS